MNTIETGPSNNARVSGDWSRSWTHFRVDRRSPRCCYLTFDHPPINTITATTVAELRDLAGLIEHDPDLNVVELGLTQTANSNDLLGGAGSSRFPTP